MIFDELHSFLIITMLIKVWQISPAVSSKSSYHEPCKGVRVIITLLGVWLIQYKAFFLICELLHSLRQYFPHFLLTGQLYTLLPALSASYCDTCCPGIFLWSFTYSSVHFQALPSTIPAGGIGIDHCLHSHLLLNVLLQRQTAGVRQRAN